ncbi:MAG: hypothetical protein E7643_00030 [Ruminococcaceae bacterium]|nr:hypothetical protein [Oscillospiraceae bacterium]
MKAIVYTSNTGHTAQYAKILGKQTGLPVFFLDEALTVLPRGTEIVYMGWLFANSVKGYKKAAKRFSVRAVCGVGLCDTGALLEEVRAAISLPEDVPLFTMQGGIDRKKLKGINKFMIGALTKSVAGKKDPTEDDRRMLELLTHDTNYVSEMHTKAFAEWFESLKK